MASVRLPTTPVRTPSVYSGGRNAVIPGSAGSAKKKTNVLEEYMCKRRLRVLVVLLIMHAAAAALHRLRTASARAYV